MQQRNSGRWVLHGIAAVGWGVGLASDVKRHRWGAFAFATGCHIAAEIVGRVGQAAIDSRAN